MEMESVARNYSPVLARATKGKMAAFKVSNWIGSVHDQSPYTTRLTMNRALPASSF